MIVQVGKYTLSCPFRNQYPMLTCLSRAGGACLVNQDLETMGLVMTADVLWLCILYEITLTDLLVSLRFERAFLHLLLALHISTGLQLLDLSNVLIREILQILQVLFLIHFVFLRHNFHRMLVELGFEGCLLQGASSNRTLTWRLYLDM
jgi:hypothetical protein